MIVICNRRNLRNLRNYQLDCSKEVDGSVIAMDCHRLAEILFPMFFGGFSPT